MTSARIMPDASIPLRWLRIAQGIRLRVGCLAVLCKEDLLQAHFSRFKREYACRLQQPNKRPHRSIESTLNAAPRDSNMCDPVQMLECGTVHSTFNSGIDPMHIPNPKFFHCSYLSKIAIMNDPYSITDFLDLWKNM